jgi:hypothetical protein
MRPSSGSRLLVAGKEIAKLSLKELEAGSVFIWAILEKRSGVASSSDTTKRRKRVVDLMNVLLQFPA